MIQERTMSTQCQVMHFLLLLVHSFSSVIDRQCQSNVVHFRTFVRHCPVPQCRSLYLCPSVFMSIPAFNYPRLSTAASVSGGLMTCAAAAEDTNWTAVTGEASQWHRRRLEDTATDHVAAGQPDSVTCFWPTPASVFETFEHQQEERIFGHSSKVLQHLRGGYRNLQIVHYNDLQSSGENNFQSCCEILFRSRNVFWVIPPH